jgi:hypothetical protein
VLRIKVTADPETGYLLLRRLDPPDPSRDIVKGLRKILDRDDVLVLRDWLNEQLLSAAEPK